MRKFLPFLLVLTACTSSSGVLRTGPDSYTVRTTASHGAGGGAAAKRSAYEDANKECTRQNKAISVVSEQAGNPTWTDGMYSIDLTFRCA
jgi:dTDP-4-dehydrorhamnose reductase